MTPGAAMTRYFVIAGNGRTGSTWLQTSLDRLPDVVCRRELKWPSPCYSLAPVHQGLDLNTEDIREVLEQVADGTGQARVLGSKLIFDLYPVLQPPAFAHLRRIVGASVRVAHLKRRYFDVFLSWRARDRIGHELFAEARGEDDVDEVLIEALAGQERSPRPRPVHLTRDGAPLADISGGGDGAAQIEFADAIEDLLTLFHNDFQVFRYLHRSNGLYRTIEYDIGDQGIYDLAAFVGSAAEDAEIRSVVQRPTTKRMSALSQDLVLPSEELVRMAAILDRVFAGLAPDDARSHEPLITVDPEEAAFIVRIPELADAIHESESITPERFKLFGTPGGNALKWPISRGVHGPTYLSHDTAIDDTLAVAALPEDIREVLPASGDRFGDPEFVNRLMYSAYGRVMHWPVLTGHVSRGLAELQPDGWREDPGPEAAAISADLRRDALAEPGLSFAPDQVREVVEYCRARPCYNGHIAEAASDRDTRRYIGAGAEEFSFGSYPTCDILACPHILEQVLQPAIIDTATEHLGCVPTLSAIQLWWTFSAGDHVVESGYAPRYWHRDLNDLGMFWVYAYLSDVAAEDGAHEILLGTHRPEVVEADLLASRQRGDELGVDGAPLTLQHLFDQFGYQIPQEHFAALFGHRRKAVLGDAGKMFFSDGLAFHRVVPPRPGSARLLLAARFSLNPIVRLGPEPHGNRAPAKLFTDRIRDEERTRYVTRHLLRWDG